MMRTNHALVALGLAGALLMAPAAGAADLEAAKAKVKEVCSACHGMDGNSPDPANPRLAGQYQDYLAKALRDYKSGARKNAIMAAFATTLTAKDIDNLSAYFAAQSPVLSARY